VIGLLHVNTAEADAFRCVETRLESLIQSQASCAQDTQRRIAESQTVVMGAIKDLVGAMGHGQAGSVPMPTVSVPTVSMPTGPQAGASDTRHEIEQVV
jgi:hypothetical protein